MTSTSDRSHCALVHGDSISRFREYRHVLPVIACDGLYPAALGKDEEHERFAACRSLCSDIQRHWLAEAEGRPITPVELQSLKQSVRNSGIGLTGSEMAWLWSVLDARLGVDVSHARLVL